MNQHDASAVETFTLSAKLRRDWTRNKSLYLLFLPVLVYYLIFQYGPMLGLVISFQNYKPSTGFLHSKWVGLAHFKDFFTDYYFQRVLFNTLKIAFYTLVVTFPMPIILALLINELKSRRFSRVVQTVTYIPHFISIVVVVSIMMDLTCRDGAIPQFLQIFGFTPVTMLNEKRFFVPLYIISAIWQNVGWNSIVYLSALTAIDAQLYEAARIDGAGKIRQLFSVTLPCLLPTIIIMLILQVGRMFNVGYEKIILMYNPLTYEVADVISTYVYRKGLLEMNWSYSAAVGMFNSVVSFFLVWFTNKLSQKLSDSSLW
ncbi:MAG TPA: ABC transporter permease subunit [Sphaerochaeta sp.]|jgi:putative aldouronate transport system permease protein|nr:ABC transporter permease subunit [Sphaerochaeta sp.]HPZ15728.1 ABC transporter permease subunit [Sphaerochaeta sp.]